MRLMHLVVLAVMIALLGLAGADDMENQSLLEKYREAVMVIGE